MQRRAIRVLLRRFYPAPFSLTAITLDMGYPGIDFSPVAALCRELQCQPGDLLEFKDDQND